MATSPFINLYRTLDEALMFKDSPINSQYIYTGVQLKPFNTEKYIQITDTSDGIDLEDWTVKVLNVCGNNPVVEARSNLLLYSESITNAIWNKNQSFLSGKKVIAESVFGSHGLSQDINRGSVAGQYTFSVFVKPSELSIISLYVEDDSVTAQASVGFSCSTQSFFGGFGFGGFDFVSSSYSVESDGYYRVSMKVSLNTIADVKLKVLMHNIGGASDYTGNDIRGLFLDKFQFQNNNLTSYVETNNAPINILGGIGTDITDYFLVESLTNSTNGNPQLYWSLLNVPFDFGWKLIYLEITQDLGETFYSSAFMLTEIDSELTSQLHYKEKKAGVYQSISLRTWFSERDKKTELSTYWQVSTKNTVSTAVKSKKIELFRTERMPRDTIILLTDVLENPILYLNAVRYSLFEAIDIPKKQGQENYTSIEYSLSPNYSENFFALPDYNGIDYGEPDYNT